VTPDAINGLFEACGALFVALNVRRVLKDKRVAGVSPVCVTFFVVWGYWNLYFYPHLDQWWSTCAAGAVALVNTAWLAGLVYYGRKR
jgi:membrane protein YdbS with pleckstrin-like domain